MAQPPKSRDLYGRKPASKPPPKATPSGTTFSAQLSSLLTTASTNPPGKPTRPTKDDLLPTPNRGAKKRALSDMLAHSGPTSEDATWRASQRKMDEKARFYSALRRGDIEDTEDKYAVDFDRKWAEREGAETESSDSDGGVADDGEEVEWTDDLGRTRTGTKTEKARQERREARWRRAAEATANDRGRPEAPEGLIYGDTVQSQAWNEDGRMEELVAKREREETPPGETHYDGGGEVRTKGTGFYAFSQDEEKRREQMRELDELREETRRARAEKRGRREEEREKRQREIEERRKGMEGKEVKRFLNSVLDEMPERRVERFDVSDESDGGGEAAEARD